MLDTASAAGSWKSSVALGVLARDGKGKVVDSAAAYYHFQVAILQGGEPAKQLLVRDLQTLSAKLKPEQSAELAANANTWFGQHQLALAFVYRDGENWKRFPASARTASASGVQAAQQIPFPPA